MDAKTEKYPKARFRTPSPSGYVYIGLSVDPPRVPLVRKSRKRDDAIVECQALAKKLADHPEVVRTRVFESILMPPLKGLPRCDVLMLVETSSPHTIADVEASVSWRDLDAEMVIPARNPARIGDTENPSEGVYLFNHFLAEDGEEATRVWEGLTGWYTEKTGVDNSTPLLPVEDARFAVINYARIPGRAVPFLLKQLLRPSFHGFVRKRLKANGMTALPLLCRPVN